MRISSNGEVTIPAELRDRCGLQPGTEVEFEPVEGGLLLRAAEKACEPEPRAVPAGKTRGELLVERLTGKGDFGGMTTDEIMAELREPLPD